MYRRRVRRRPNPTERSSRVQSRVSSPRSRRLVVANRSAALPLHSSLKAPRLHAVLVHRSRGLGSSHQRRALRTRATSRTISRMKTTRSIRHASCLRLPSSPGIIAASERGRANRQTKPDGTTERPTAVGRMPYELTATRGTPHPTSRRHTSRVSPSYAPTLGQCRDAGYGTARATTETREFRGRALDATPPLWHAVTRLDHCR